MSIRLGMIGTGRIANRFAQDAWQGLPVRVQAVYNPREGAAAGFAAKHNLPSGTGCWADFTEQIDAVYIASPTASHGVYIRLLLEAGKHVLCEKPMALNASEAETLFALAESKGLILMEAVKTAYCPGFLALLKVLEEGKIGEIRDVEACFTRLTDPRLREMTDLIYGGSMTELGTYGSFAVMKILGLDYEKTDFSVQRNESGIDIFTKIFFEYRDGRRSGFVKSGLGVKSEGELIVSGTEGYILARAPWWMTKHFEIRYEDPGKRDCFDYPFEGSGLQYELRYFLERIRDPGVKDCVTPRESVALAGLMECFLLREHRKIGE